MCSNSNKGVLLSPNVEVTVMTTPALESQTIPQRICQTTRKCHSGIKLNSKLGEGRLTVEQKYMKHSNGRAKGLCY